MSQNLETILYAKATEDEVYSTSHDRETWTGYLGPEHAQEIELVRRRDILAWIDNEWQNALKEHGENSDIALGMKILARELKASVQEKDAEVKE